MEPADPEPARQSGCEPLPSPLLLAYRSAATGVGTIRKCRSIHAVAGIIPPWPPPGAPLATDVPTSERPGVRLAGSQIHSHEGVTAMAKTSTVTACFRNRFDASAAYDYVMGKG